MESETDDMSGVRESFRKQFNLSSGILDLIIKFWSESTAKQYAPHPRRLLSFCSNGLDSLNAGLISRAEFLTQYFRRASCETLQIIQLIGFFHLLFQELMYLPLMNDF